MRLSLGFVDCALNRRRPGFGHTRVVGRGRMHSSDRSRNLERTVARSKQDGKAQSTARRPAVLAFVLLTVGLVLIGRLAIGRIFGARNTVHEGAAEAGGQLESALERMPDAARLPYLLKAAQDPSPGLRYAAVDALSRYHSTDAADAIEFAFLDSASTVR